MRHVGFLDNVRSHFRNNDEEEFERAFHEGVWPEGIEPMTNTGSFLPATFDVDPLADASLPGNAMNAARNAAAGAAGDGGTPAGVPAEPAAATESVVRAAATSIYAAPVAPSPFQVIDSSLRPRGASAASAPRADAAPAPAAAEQPSGQMPAAEERPSGYSAGTPRYDMGDDGVQVFSRPAGERAVRPAAVAQPPQKPFADRLRERVAAANVSGQFDETIGRSRAATQEPPARPVRRNENASDAELDAELEERRRSRAAHSQARHERAMRSEAELREHVEHAAAERAQRREEERAEEARPAAAPEPAVEKPHLVPISCTAVRPRSYDDVRDIAQAVIAEHRPAVIVMRGCSNDLARRVLDFSFGLCCASGAGMRELGDHVYAVLPRGTALTDDDMAALRRQGVVR